MVLGPSSPRLSFQPTRSAHSRSLQWEAERASGPPPWALPAVPPTQTCPGLPPAAGLRWWTRGGLLPAPHTCSLWFCPIRLPRAGLHGLVSDSAVPYPVRTGLEMQEQGRGEAGMFLVLLSASELLSRQGLLPGLGLAVVAAPAELATSGLTVSRSSAALLLLPRSSRCQPSASWPGPELHVGTAWSFLGKTGNSHRAALPPPQVGSGFSRSGRKIATDAQLSHSRKDTQEPARKWPLGLASLARHL